MTFRTILSVPVLLLFAACDGGDGGGGDDKDSGDTTGGGTVTDITIDDYINVTEPYAGDTSCYDGTAWITQTVATGCDAEMTLNGWVEDFESGDNVGDASVEFYFSDDINSSADVTLTAGSDGTFTTSVPACTPLGYKTYTPAEWQETRDTYEVHQIWGWESDGALDEPINSVSVSTSTVIPALLGVEWISGTGIVAGTAYDCNEEPIEAAQVFVHDGNNNPAPGVNVFYFLNEFPNDSQPYTSEDGLWVAINVPTGTWTVDMWVWNGSEHTLLGQTQLTIMADSVNVSNVFTGHNDGIRYPESCLSACQ